MKLNLYLTRIVLFLGMVLGTNSLLPGNMQAMALTRILDNSEIHFRQPSTGESSAPQDRPRGGGARPACSGSVAVPACSGLELMALVPSPETGQAWGQTIASAPTLWFYVPYAQTDIYSMEFELWDEDNNLIVQDRQVSIPATPGITSYQVAAATPLEVGKTYRWYLLLRFDPNNPSLDEYVSGRIERIAAADLSGQLEAALPLEQAQLLAEAGVWYDTLTVLAAVQAEQPEIWSQFLQAVGLSAIAEEPLVSAYQ